MQPCIGVLALQGDFDKHAAMLQKVGAFPLLVRYPKDLEACQGLILPGGESTSLQRQIDFIGLRAPLIEFAKRHPLFGTCAGLILMARDSIDGSIDTLGILDVQVARNAYGRQSDSFVATLQTAKTFPSLQGVFIRAPQIVACGVAVTILATFEGRPVCVRQTVGNVTHIGACFHPELSQDASLHRLFYDLILEK